MADAVAGGNWRCRRALKGGAAPRQRTLNTNWGYKSDNGPHDGWLRGIPQWWTELIAYHRKRARMSHLSAADRSNTQGSGGA